MDVDFHLDGLEKSWAAIDSVATSIGFTTREAVSAAAHLIEKQAKINASGRPGPNVRTGTLRRSIRVTGPRPWGVGGWEAMVGPTVVYGRRVELGGGNWPAGTKFPYMGPAASFAQRIGLRSLFSSRWSAAFTKLA